MSGQLKAVGEIAVDGRQSETALAVARGTMRLLRSLGYCCVSELPLPSGRRADLVALDGGGEIWIVEIKSSLADFRADQKWPDYRLHCDRLFFATTHRLAAATRKGMMLRVAQCAALRLQSLIDPHGPYGEIV